MIKWVWFIGFAIIGGMIGLKLGTMLQKPQQQDVSQNNETRVKSKVVFETRLGNIVIGLYDTLAPVTVENFLTYVDEGFYEGTIFHRVIDGFMIQGGGYDSDLKQKATKAPIKNEANNGIKNKRATLAMARTQVIDSATAQFFINVADNASLDFRDESIQGYGYCVFGEVLEGMDVVDAIKQLKVSMQGMHQHLPQEAVVILSAKRVGEFK